MARYALIACEVMTRMLEASLPDTEHELTLEWVDLGLHTTPKKLRERLQEIIDALDPADYDAVLLLFGICGKAALVKAPPQLPLIIPRAHDCITLYLGSAEHFQQVFDNEPGTYWYSVDYMTRNSDHNNMLGALSMGMEDDDYAHYVEKYGKLTADAIREALTGWQAHYHRAVFLDDGLGGDDLVRNQARGKAESEGWRFEVMRANSRLVEMLIKGEWPEAEFLVVPPGWRVELAPTDGLIRAVRD